MQRVRIWLMPWLALAVLAGCTVRSDISVDDEGDTSPTPEASASPEGVMMEKGTLVRFLNLGAKAVAGRPMEVVWQVKPDKGEKTIGHTAVHFDPVSHPGDFGTDVTADAAGYAELTPEFTKEIIVLKSPRAFTAKITPKVGTLYLRAHAVIDGKNYWTAEEQVEVAARAEDVGSGDNAMKKDDEGATIKVDVEAKAMVGAKAFTLTAKQWEFSPKTITVKKGEKVKLTLKSVDVAHGFLLPEFNINQRLEPGQTVTVEFTADKAGQFSFRCSVPCGSGHADMTGTLIVQ